MKRHTPLARWMFENGYQDTDFAAAVVENMRQNGVEIPRVSARAVAKWRSGIVVPRRETLKAIMRITGLSADAFVMSP